MCAVFNSTVSSVRGEELFHIRPAGFFSIFLRSAAINDREALPPHYNCKRSQGRLPEAEATANRGAPQLWRQVLKPHPLAATAARPHSRSRRRSLCLLARRCFRHRHLDRHVIQAEGVY